MWLVKNGINKKEKERLIDSGEIFLLGFGKINADNDIIDAG